MTVKPKAMPPTSATGGETSPLPARSRPRKKIDRASKVFAVYRDLSVQGAPRPAHEWDKSPLPFFSDEVFPVPCLLP